MSAGTEATTQPFSPPSVTNNRSTVVYTPLYIPIRVTLKPPLPADRASLIAMKHTLVTDMQAKVEYGAKLLSHIQDCVAVGARVHADAAECSAQLLALSKRIEAIDARLTSLNNEHVAIYKKLQGQSFAQRLITAWGANSRLQEIKTEKNTLAAKRLKLEKKHAVVTRKLQQAESYTREYQQHQGQLEEAREELEKTSAAFVRLQHKLSDVDQALTALDRTEHSTTATDELQTATPCITCAA